MYYTNLKQLRDFRACGARYEYLKTNLKRKLNDTSKISMLEILKTNGIVDAIWALRTVKAKKLIVCFAADCAESVLHCYEAKYPNDDRPRKAIEAARSGAPKAAADAAAHAAAHAAANSAADAAANSAADAAYAAAHAAHAAHAAADAAAHAAAYAAHAAYAAAHAAHAAHAADAERKIQEKFYRKYFCEGCK